MEQPTSTASPAIEKTQEEIDSIEVTLLSMFSPRKHKLNWLLTAFPIALWAGFVSHDMNLAFVFSIISIMPIAFLMGKATEEIAHYYSQSIGGLLNATFGNAVELIIATIAIYTAFKDPSQSELMLIVVQASLIGSILGNILLVAGLSLLWGGIKYPNQEFSKDANASNGSLLLLAVVALMLPSALGEAGGSTSQILDLSRYTAIVLLIIYISAMFFQLKTHTHLFEIDSEDDLHELEGLTQKQAWNLLILSTIMVSIMAEILVHSIEYTAQDWSLPSLFIGVILLPFFGNAAEHFTAVIVAGKNKMDLSLGIAIGSSVQIALLIAPLMVIFAWILGVGLSLNFGPMETTATFASILIANFILSDGKSNWLEGAMLLACYVIMGLAFYTFG